MAGEPLIFPMGSGRVDPRRLRLASNVSGAGATHRRVTPPAIAKHFEALEDR
jgi:hypothetical protein